VLEGAKWYGYHLGPYKTPAREDDPPCRPAYFYEYQHECVLDWQRRGGRWGWSTTRPGAVCGYSPVSHINLMSVVGLVVAGTVATVVLTFNSWRLSLIAFVVAGLSAGLSLLALEIFRFPFGINALIGVIESIGVSVNAAIIILTAMQADGGAMAGDRAAMRDVVMRAGRHIVSTTVTTFGGFLPLILAGGQFWPPFAMAVAGGVLLSTVTSFYFTPPAFALLNGRLPTAAPALRPAARMAAE